MKNLYIKENLNLKKKVIIKLVFNTIHKDKLTMHTSSVKFNANGKEYKKGKEKKNKNKKSAGKVSHTSRVGVVSAFSLTTLSIFPSFAGTLIRSVGTRTHR